MRTGEAEGAVEGKMGQMSLTLEKSISNLNDELIGLFAGLNEGDFVDPSCDPKIVLEKLAGVQEQLGAIEEKAEGYKAMQETFHVPVYEFKQLKDTTSQFELKEEMWSSIKQGANKRKWE